ncbi:DUF1367 family protein [Chitiniphilus shinanonensis]|uniref:DUF1367 family protein n=1 Tax=Chitiniphilus shinanonensis TaxID=553088 RepID=UPI00334105B5
MLLIKAPGGALVPADDLTRAALAKFKTGQGVSATIKRARRIQFHRKAFALFQLAFDAWEPAQMHYKGEPVGKSFDRFRKDLLILAGHYTTSVNLKGEVRLEAKSISFAALDEAEFDRIYRSVLNVVWDKVLCHVAGYHSTEQIDALVNELMGFE